MATKKKTITTRTRKTRKAASVKSRGAKNDEAEAAASELSAASEVAGEGGPADGATKPAPRTRIRKKKARTRSGKDVTTAPSENGSATVDEESSAAALAATAETDPAPAPAGRPELKPLSTTAQVERQGNSIVIRFPPVARNPFADAVAVVPGTLEPSTVDTALPADAPVLEAPGDEPSAVPPAGEGSATDADDALELQASEVELEPLAGDDSADQDLAEAEAPDEALVEEAATATTDEPTETPPEEARRGRGRRRRRRGRSRRGEDAATPDAESSKSAAGEDASGADLREAGVAAPDEPPVPDGAKQELVGDRLSPSQKRRQRRRRRRGGGDGERMTSAPDTSEADEADAAASAADEVDAFDERAEGDDFDDLLADAGDFDLGDDEDVATEEPEGVEPEDVEEEAADSEAAADRGRGDRRRLRRGRRGRRGYWRDRDESIEVVLDDEEPAAPAAPSNLEMIINVVPREECRIGILENSKLEEIYLERASSENHVGNIYKGIVTNVEPSIQAAFIDFGMSKNGFLHISDLHPEYFPNGGQAENVGKKIPRRNRPPIQKCLKRGQEVIVQLTKEGIGTKGPTLTTYLSIPGRYLVMMPGMRRLGVSRKIEDDEARRKIRDLMNGLELPEGMGFIARTAAQERPLNELQADLNYLTRLWRTVERRAKKERAPAELYTESDLVIRTIRDVFTSEIQKIIVDDAQVAERARDFLSIFSPQSRDLVIEYQGPQPIFHKYGIEAELERLHSRHVPLKSGGSLVIDQTEALVAIDVNSGRFRTEDDAETTAFRINLEAANEIPRQLRLRDLGGVVVCDFIDMREEKHRREIERVLARNLKQHKERAKVLRTSQFGMIELTRQRQRAGLTRAVYQDCRHCRGTGLVKTAESVALDVMRLIQLAVCQDNIRTIEVAVSGEVAHMLLNRKRSVLNELEVKNRRTVAISAQAAYGLDQCQVRCFDARGRQVPTT